MGRKEGGVSMNKQERTVIESEINRLIERMDRREDRIDKAVAAGDVERVKIYERNDMRDQAKLDGIDFVLGYLGYRRRFDMNTNRTYLQRIEG
jgi:hypothetical protein